MTGLFQTDSFSSFISNTGFLIPFRFIRKKDDVEVGIIQGFIQKDGNTIKQFLSRRAIINGGPFFAEDITDKDARALILDCIDGLRSKVIYIETRNFNDYTRFRPLFEKCGFIYEPHYDYIINTETLDIAEENLGKSRKRDIKSSVKNGATIVDNPSEDQIKAFYCILDNLYKNKVKTPLFPMDFFLKLNQEQFSRFLLIKYQGDIIGGTVCVYDDETVYEWFACGKDGVFKNVFPSTLATWAGIKFAAESGHKRFDMMGAGFPGDNGYGVREFKAKFGGELVEYGRFKYICNKPLYSIGKWGINLIKKR